MRAKYSIGVVALGWAVFSWAGCPPGLTSIAAAVAQLRSVKGPFSPPCRDLPVTALRQELDRKVRRDLPLAPELYLEALKRMGMVEASTSFTYSRLLDFYASQVLGFYEPESDEMVLVYNPLASSDQTRLVWAHELAHAAQEHRFALPSRILEMRNNGDAQRAASAMAEGEAMLVMFLLAGGGGSTDDSLALAEQALASQAHGLVPAADVPEFFAADLVFPYTTGFSTVLRRYRSGGWSAVDALLAAPPPSTSALLHPERKGTTTMVESSRLPSPPAGWEEVITDTLGEWGLRFWLSRRLGEELSADLASSWNGDRLRLIRRTDDPERWALAFKLCTLGPDGGKLVEALRAQLPSLLRHLSQSPANLSIAWDPSTREASILSGWPGEAATDPPPLP